MDTLLFLAFTILLAFGIAYLSHFFLYPISGIAIILSAIIICTWILWHKLDDLKKSLSQNKDEPHAPDAP